MLDELLTQTEQAAAYYGALIILMRLAGKRLAGQTTTFDLIVLITLGVVLQSTALQAGTWNAIVFVITVFALHRMLALLCAPRVHPAVPSATGRRAPNALLARVARSNWRPAWHRCGHPGGRRWP